MDCHLYLSDFYCRQLTQQCAVEYGHHLLVKGLISNDVSYLPLCTLLFLDHGAEEQTAEL